VQFTAIVTGTENTGVTWSVLSENGGTITSTGLYTAPGSAQSDLKVRHARANGTSTYTIQGTSQADPTKSATATVTVTTPAVVGITVTPATSYIGYGNTLQYTAHVTGTTNTAVTWSVVTANSGTISSTGLYTAPSLNDGIQFPKKSRWEVQQSLVVTIKAVSVADTTKFATATVTVQPVEVQVSPTNPIVYVNQTVQFTATVSLAQNTKVTWSVNGGGSITQTGLFTAPSTPGNNFEVIATSQEDPSVYANAYVTVESHGPVVVTISPTTVQLGVGDDQYFATTVTGTTNQALTWKVTPTGLGAIINSNGVFEAPDSLDSTPTTFTITATSVADPTKSASATAVVTQNQLDLTKLHSKRVAGAQPGRASN
jgi:hypothetical protein